MKILLGAIALTTTFAFSAPPRDSVPVDAREWPANYRLHAGFSSPAGGAIELGKDLVIPLTSASEHDVAVEYPEDGEPVFRVWADGKLVKGPQELQLPTTMEFPDAKIDLGADFTTYVRFETSAEGSLFSLSNKTGKPTPDGKSLSVQQGKLVYDIGVAPALAGGRKVGDGKAHTAVLMSRGGNVRLWLDGKVIAEKAGFTNPDAPGGVFKIGGDFAKGKIETVRVWARALEDAEVETLFKKGGSGANTPDFSYIPAESVVRPVIKPAPGATVTSSWVQELERSDHSEIVGGWNDKTLAEGREIYTTYCTVCHGTKDQPGSLPTALRFAEGTFKNGSDPHSMFLTLTKGYGQMVSQPQYTTAQKYSVIQYIRETFLKPHNATQFTPVTPDYLALLPKGLALAEKEKEDRSQPQYKRMDLGPALFWTYQIEKGNIAQKGIAIRLDDGPGGVSKGRAWMVYDHDTMRVAAATTGDFVDWKGIAFDGSHNSHTSLTGERQFVNPVGPGWASPEGKWEDPRPLSREELPYGPLPREWASYEGLYLQGGKAVVALTVGGTRVLESPGWLDYGATPVFSRTLNVDEREKRKESQPLSLRVAPDSINVVLAGDGTLRKEAGFWVASLEGGAKTRLFISKADPASLAALAKSFTDPLDLQPLTKGGPRRWNGEVTTSSEAGKADGPFASDTFPLPINNPWQSWMRPGGFDFTPDGKAAIVATWNGDVWRVDGLMAPAPAPLTWRRIATGLFQPLGVKFRGDELFVTCRDQTRPLARPERRRRDRLLRVLQQRPPGDRALPRVRDGPADRRGGQLLLRQVRPGTRCRALVPHHGTLLRGQHRTARRPRFWPTVSAPPTASA